MNLIELKCKHCGGTLKVNPELDEIVCIYCGTKILIDDETIKIKIVEDAKLKARKENYEQDLKENCMLRILDSENLTPGLFDNQDVTLLSDEDVETTYKL